MKPQFVSHHTMVVKHIYDDYGIDGCARACTLQRWRNWNKIAMVVFERGRAHLAQNETTHLRLFIYYCLFFVRLLSVTPYAFSGMLVCI